MGWVEIEELLGSQVAEGLVRADGVIDFFPLPQFAVEGVEVQGIGMDLIELLGVGAVDALDRAIEFGGAGRQDEQQQSALLAGLLELGGELAAAVDLAGRGWGKACGAARCRGNRWRPGRWRGGGPGSRPSAKPRGGR